MKIGELVAYMRVDDSQFQSGMGRGKKAMESMAGLAKTAGKTIATTFTVGSTVAAGMATNVIKTGAAYNSLQQNSRAALSVMLGGAEKANAQMDKLDAWAKNSPFAKQVFIDAQQQMLGFGVAVEDVIPALDAIQNAIAAQGKGAAEIERATYAFSQMSAAGKYTGETIRDLSVLGINSAEIIGQKMGKTGAEIRDMASKPGGIPADQVWDILVDGLTEKFGGATDNIKQQWTGAVDRIKGAWRDIGSHIAKPFIDPNGGGKAIEWANLVADGLRGIEKHVKTAMPIIENAMGGTFGKVEGHLRKANAAIAGFNLQGFIRQLQAASKYEPLIAGLSGTLFTLGMRNIPVISGLAGGIMPLVVGIGALVATDDRLRGLGDAFQQGLGNAGNTIDDLVVSAADLAMKLISELAPGLLAGAEGAGKLAGMGIDLASMLIDVLSAGTPVIGMASDMVGWFVQLPAPVLAGVAAFAAMKALGMPTLFNEIKSAGKGFMEPIRQSMQASRDMSSQFGMELGRVQTALLSGRAAVAGFGTAMKAAFISNAPMLAITALVTVLGAFAQAKAESKARIDEWKDTLDQATGTVTENTSALVANRLAEADLGDSLKTLGISHKDFADAIQGVPDAQARVNAALDKAKASYEGLNSIQLLSNDTARANSEAIGLLQPVYNQLTGELEQAGQAWQEEARYTGNATDASDAHAESLKRQQDAVNLLQQAERDLAAAKGDLVSAQYASKDALDAWNQVIGETERVTRDASGAIDTTTDSYRKFDEAALSAQQAMTRELEAMAKAGATQDDLNTKRDEFLGKQRANIEAWGLEGAEVDSYVDRIGGIPEVKSLKIDANTDEGKKKVDAFLAELAEKKGDLLIDANDNPAVAQLAETLGLVEVSEGVFALGADANPAVAEWLATLGVIDTSTGTLTIAGDDEPVNAAIQEAIDLANGSTGTATIAGDNTPGKAATSELVTLTNNARPKVLIGGNNQPGKNEANLLEAYINRKAPSMGISAYDNGATATAQRIASTIASMSFSVPIMAGQGGITRADGGLVDFFANGGRSGGPEQHIAQYVPAGTWRVFGEDETGGEWYIPRAMSKRSRSLQIAAQMVDEFGYQMIPKTAQTFADGGQTGALSTPTQAGYSITIGNITIPLDDLAQIQDLADFVELLRVKTMMQGVG